MLVAECAACGAKFSAQEKFAGRKMRCKNCSGVVTVPLVDPDAAGGGPKNEDETAVLTPQERAELERTRPKAAGKPKLGAGPRPGLASRGTVKPSPRGRPGLRPTLRRDAGEGAAAGTGPSKKRLYALVGVAVAVLAVAAMVWVVILREPEKDSPSKGAGQTAAKDAGKAAVPKAARVVDVPALIPQEAGFVVRIDVERLVPWVEKLASALGEEFEPEKLVEKLPEPLRQLFSDAEIDLLQDVKTVWIAGPSGMPSEGPSGMVVVEGELSEEKLTAALRKAGHLKPPPRDAGSLTAHAMEIGEQPLRLAFLSAGRVLLATDAYLDKVSELQAGDGVPVTEKSVLRELSGDFKAPAVAWMVAEVEKLAAAKEGSAEPAETSEPPEAGEPAVAMPQLLGILGGEGGLPNFDAVLVRLGPDASGSGLDLTLTGAAPSVDVAKAEAIKLEIARLWFANKAKEESGHLPPAFVEVVTKVTVRPREHFVDVTLTVPGEVLGELAAFGKQFFGGEDGAPPMLGEDSEAPKLEDLKLENLEDEKEDESAKDAKDAEAEKPDAPKSDEADGKDDADSEPEDPKN
jgi:hypothetical protein